MSKFYKCKIEKDLYSAWVESELELSPQDYLFCEDEDDLINSVEDDLRYSINIGNVQYKDWDFIFDIPQSFKDEWKQLKSKMK